MIAVTRKETIEFLEEATRNWPNFLEVGSEEVEDFQVALNSFVNKRIAAALEEQSNG